MVHTQNVHVYAHTQRELNATNGERATVKAIKGLESNGGVLSADPFESAGSDPHASEGR